MKYIVNTEKNGELKTTKMTFKNDLEAIKWAKTYSRTEEFDGIEVLDDDDNQIFFRELTSADFF